MTRIQRKRTKGSKLPAGTVCVTRPGRWGNPFRVADGYTAEEAVWWFRECLLAALAGRPLPTGPRGELSLREAFAKMARNLHYLAGHDLACFCPVGSPCHGDVLLELASATRIEERVR